VSLRPNLRGTCYLLTRRIHPVCYVLPYSVRSTWTWNIGDRNTTPIGAIPPVAVRCVCARVCVYVSVLRHQVDAAVSVCFPTHFRRCLVSLGPRLFITPHFRSCTRFAEAIARQTARWHSCIPLGNYIPALQEDNYRRDVLVVPSSS
jgi:hypothetical protein